VYEHQYFELDRIFLPNEELFRLEIELTEENDRPILPPFIRVRQEVTDDSRYSNRALAER
jgi:CYTH domain-containing protein